MNRPNGKRRQNPDGYKRHGADHYVEPLWCDRLLFAAERFTGTVEDPCCGWGRVLRAAAEAGHPVAGSDLVDRGWPGCRIEGLMTRRRPAENMVSNPPFDILESAIAKMLKLTLRKLAVIFPTSQLNAAQWLTRAPLARVWLLTPRPSMPPGHKLRQRTFRAQGGRTDYCWLVFDRTHHGAPQFGGWLHRDLGVLRAGAFPAIPLVRSRTLAA